MSAEAAAAAGSKASSKTTTCSSSEATPSTKASVTGKTILILKSLSKHSQKAAHRDDLLEIKKSTIFRDGNQPILGMHTHREVIRRPERHPVLGTHAYREVLSWSPPAYPGYTEESSASMSQCYT